MIATDAGRGTWRWPDALRRAAPAHRPRFSNTNLQHSALVRVDL